MVFSPRDTSTQHLDRGWRNKMGEEMLPSFPSRDYVIDGPHNFMDIRNIFTGKVESVLIDPNDHQGYTTRQQQEAVASKLFFGNGVRISIEGNIGSGITAVTAVTGYCHICIIFRKIDFGLVADPVTQEQWVAELVVPGEDQRVEDRQVSLAGRGTREYKVNAIMNVIRSFLLTKNETSAACYRAVRLSSLGAH